MTIIDKVHKDEEKQLKDFLIGDCFEYCGDYFLIIGPNENLRLRTGEIFGISQSEKVIKRNATITIT